MCKLFIFVNLVVTYIF